MTRNSQREQCAVVVARNTAAPMWRPTLLVLCLCLLVLAQSAAVAATHAGSDASSGSGQNASVILFAPATPALNNPVDGHHSAGSDPVTVNLTVYDSHGHVMQPSESNPLHVHVYGAPDGVITPIDSVLTSGTSVTFTYNGGDFPNNMELAGWMDDPSTGGASLGTTLFIHANRPACGPGTASFPLNVTSNVPNEIQVKAVVGADNPAQSQFKTFTIDTGSLGVIVTKSSLVAGNNVHGPGARGQKFYDSSGYVFTGNYYLAPVSVQLQDGTFVQSNPIIILAVDGVHCQSGYKKCHTSGKADLHYLGVGFDRNTTGTGDLFDSPSENAFLELTDSQNGLDINGGYILSSSGMTVGLTAENTSGFNNVTLNPNPNVPGDWNPEPGCFSFPGLDGAPKFCGNLLLDVGISEMFMDAAYQNWPTGSYDPNHKVPDGVEMKIQAGPANNPAMSYEFSAVQPPEQPTGPAPTYAQWINDSTIFVNTGRRPLLSFDYFYSGRCGVVGYKPN